MKKKEFGTPSIHSVYCRFNIWCSTMAGES